MLLRPSRAGQGKRPTGPFAINRQSPQAIGLLYWWPLLPQTRRDYVTGRDSTLNNLTGSNWHGSTDGLVLNWPAQGGDYYVITPTLTFAGAFTIAAWGALAATTDNPRLFGTVGRTLEMYVDGNSGDMSSHLGGAEDNSGPVVPLTVPTLLVYSFDGTTITYSAWPTAGAVGFQSSSAAVSSPTVNAAGLIGGLDVAGRSNWLGDLWDVRLYNRALAQAEVVELYDPPTRWGLYWQPSTRVFFTSTAVAAVVGRRYTVQQAVNRASTY